MKKMWMSAVISVISICLSMTVMAQENLPDAYYSDEIYGDLVRPEYDYSDYLEKLGPYKGLELEVEVSEYIDKETMDNYQIMCILEDGLWGAIPEVIYDACAFSGVPEDVLEYDTRLEYGSMVRSIANGDYSWDVVVELYNLGQFGTVDGEPFYYEPNMTGLYEAVKSQREISLRFEILERAIFDAENVDYRLIHTYFEEHKDDFMSDYFESDDIVIQKQTESFVERKLQKRLVSDILISNNVVIPVYGADVR